METKESERQRKKTIRLNWLRRDLNRAYEAASRGKSKKPQVVQFADNLELNIEALVYEIYSKSYRPRPSTAFIVNKPVKREIFAADFRDRVVHHFLFNQVNSWWDARFINDNYNDRDNGIGVR